MDMPKRDELEQIGLYGTFLQGLLSEESEALFYKASQLWNLSFSYEIPTLAEIVRT